MKKKKVEEKIKKDFYSFQKKINRLEEIKRELNSLQARGDTKGFEKEVHILRSRLKDVHALPELERNIKNLRLKIINKKKINKKLNVNLKSQLHNRMHKYISKQKTKQERKINSKMREMQHSLEKEHKLYEELRQKVMDQKDKIETLRRRNSSLIENQNKIKSQEVLKLKKENKLLIDKHKREMQILKDNIRKNSNRQNISLNTAEGYNNYAERSSLIASGKIEKYWVDFESYKDGKNGVLIHVDLRIENNVGSQNAVYAFFYNQDGSALKTNNLKYSSRKGQLMAFSGIITAKYQVDNIPDCKIFIPIEEIRAPSGKTQINLILYLVDLSQGVEKPRVLDKQKYPIVIAN